MFTAEVSFQIPEECEDGPEQLDALMATWRGNGQILGSEFPAALLGNIYRLFLMLPRADSLESRNDGEWVTKSKAWLESHGFQAPSITVLGEDPVSAEPCNCGHRSYFILYTTYSALESSLRCGECFGPVPRYEIKDMRTPDGDLHDLIKYWQGDYQACDHLQMGCRTGENFGLREMSNFNSSLTKQGLLACEAIMASEGIPTYYYLHRYRGRSEASEKKRKCPSCQGDWLLDEPLHELFDFKCDKCRLLSNLALSIPQK